MMKTGQLVDWSTDETPISPEASGSIPSTSTALSTGREEEPGVAFSPPWEGLGEALVITYLLKIEL
jgi:hypothetical protein